MGQTEIRWAHYTFNAWWGCVEVSVECERCYARTFAHRRGYDVWGKDAARREFGEPYWQGPITWNRSAERAGERRRVFAFSMADVLEERDDREPSRQRLWALIRETPWLDWLLLTKRAAAIGRLVPSDIRSREHVWLGVTCGIADSLWRVEALVNVAAAGPKWVSAEPLLGPLDLRPWLAKGIRWVVAGGESGAKARRMDADWARSLRDQCHAAGAAYFHKQNGGPTVNAGGHLLDGREWSEFPIAAESPQLSYRR